MSDELICPSCDCDYEGAPCICKSNSTTILSDSCSWCGRAFEEGDVVITDPVLTPACGHVWCNHVCKKAHFNSK